MSIYRQCQWTIFKITPGNTSVWLSVIVSSRERLFDWRDDQTQWWSNTVMIKHNDDQTQWSYNMRELCKWISVIDKNRVFRFTKQSCAPSHVKPKSDIIIIIIIKYIFTVASLLAKPFKDAAQCQLWIQFYYLAIIDGFYRGHPTTNMNAFMTKYINKFRFTNATYITYILIIVAKLTAVYLSSNMKDRFEI